MGRWTQRNEARSVQGAVSRRRKAAPAGDNGAGASPVDHNLHSDDPTSDTTQSHDAHAPTQTTSHPALRITQLLVRAFLMHTLISPSHPLATFHHSPLNRDAPPPPPSHNPHTARTRSSHPLRPHHPHPFWNVLWQNRSGRPPSLPTAGRGGLPRRHAPNSPSRPGTAGTGLR